MELIADFLATLDLIFDFVLALVVPASIADISLIHIAAWLPVFLAVASGAVVFMRRTWPRRVVVSGPVSVAAPSPPNDDRRLRRRQRIERLAAQRAAERSAKLAAEKAAKTEETNRIKAERAAQRLAERERLKTEKAEQLQAAKAAKAVELVAKREVAKAERAAQRLAERERIKLEKAEQAAAAKAERAAQREAVKAQRLAERAARPKRQRRAKRNTDETYAYGTDPRRSYRFRYRLVDLDDLIASNTDGGGINPAYDASLQPRERSRAASQRQIDQVAANLVPEAYLSDFRSLDRGAPIIGSDRQVESGNGRILALRRARDLYADQYGDYRAKLSKRAKELGLDTTGINNPVLVRERLDDVDRVAFAREANAPPVLQLSTLERASVEARLIATEQLTQLTVREGENLDQSLRKAANRDFVRSFVGSLPENEAATVTRRDGTLNSDGIRRIKAAVFVRTFPGESGTRLAETFLESLDSNIKNYETAIAATLPALARAESLIESGARSRDLSLGNDISVAIDMLARLRESDSITPQLYVEQSSMFERETNERQDRLLLYFDSIGRSPKAIREFLESYAAAVEAAPDPRQNQLFEVERGDLLDRLINQRPQLVRRAA